MENDDLPRLLPYHEQKSFFSALDLAKAYSVTDSDFKTSFCPLCSSAKIERMSLIKKPGTIAETAKCLDCGQYFGVVLND